MAAPPAAGRPEEIDVDADTSLETEEGAGEAPKARLARVMDLYRSQPPPSLSPLPQPLSDPDPHPDPDSPLP